MKSSSLLVAVVMLLSAAVGRAQTTDGLAGLVGGRSVYVVKPGDSLTTVSASFGVGRATLIDMNQLTPPYALSPGQSLVIDNTHIAVGHPQMNLTINIPQRLLVLTEGERVRAYPISAGKPTWPTPVGAFTIISKETDPAWDVPMSIQREMAAQGKPVVTRVEPSRRNPLGAYWIGLSLPSLGIHGTNAPSSIYSFSSHGCIRMRPEDVEHLFDRITVGMPGVLIYQPVVVATIDRRIWMEAHPDVYRRAPNALSVVRAAAERNGVASTINWEIVDTVLRERRGLAVDVTRAP
jgi:L,D-transpeptidase ErfK/SrfK